MYSHLGHAFGVLAVATAFIVTLVTCFERRLIFEICLESCDKINHKKKIVKHYRFVRNIHLNWFDSCNGAFLTCV